MNGNEAERLPDAEAESRASLLCKRRANALEAVMTVQRMPVYGVSLKSICLENKIYGKHV